MQLLKVKEVAKIFGISRATVYRWEKEGDFPSRRVIGPNTVRWSEKEIADWILSRPDASTTSVRTLEVS